MNEAAETKSEHLPRGLLIGGRYRIIRTIGRGGMGVVHEATNELTHGRVAIKTLSRAALSMDGAVQRFAREAKAAGSMRSVHVGRVLDAAVLDDGAPFLVMEFYEGRDLDGELRQYEGHLPIEDACSYIIQACAGLAEAHARGFVHRDLKPSNLFLAQEGGVRRLKVLDFGISKHLTAEDDLTKSLAAIGTPLYMSPEQVRDAKHVDHRSDVWALGVILYRMLTGIRPFHGNSTAVIAAILMEDPVPLRSIRPEIPPALEAATLRALRRDYSERFQDVGELATELAPFTDSEIARHALVEMRRAMDSPSSPSPDSSMADDDAPTHSDQDASALSDTSVDSSTTRFVRADTKPPASHARPVVESARDTVAPRSRVWVAAALMAGLAVGLVAYAAGFARRASPPATGTVQRAVPTPAIASASPALVATPPLPSSLASSSAGAGSSSAPSLPSATVSATAKGAPVPKASAKPLPSASASASIPTVDPTIL
jgi:serine/threonine protein kinase